MPATRIVANYYQQFAADYSLEVPGEGYGGWKRAEIDVDLDRAALAVMHAWDNGTMETNPRGYHNHEYLPRANEILHTVFPLLLSTARSSRLKVFHVVSRGKYYQNHPNYIATQDLAGPSSPPEQIDQGLSLMKWREELFPPPVTVKNERSLARAFASEAAPQGNEPIAKDDHQLCALCKKHNVNHLI